MAIVSNLIFPLLGCMSLLSLSSPVIRVRQSSIVAILGISTEVINRLWFTASLWLYLVTALRVQDGV
jgi:hypothetical protein